MDDETDDDAKRIKGSIKEAIGMLIGDPAVEAEGAAEKVVGKPKSAADTTKRNVSPPN